jgi:Beta-propeller repeat/Domain of unknown function (DUF4214)
MSYVQNTSRGAVARLTLALLLCALLTSNLPNASGAAAAAGRVGSSAGSHAPSESDGRRGAVAHDDVRSGRARFEEVYGKLPLQFEVNRGQADRRFDFVSRGAGYDVLLSPTEAVFGVRDGRGDAGRRVAQTLSVIGMKLQGANAQAKPSGQGPAEGRVNYFARGSSDKRVGIRAYAGVRYASVYEGVDVVYYGSQRELEYDFVVAPGGDARAVKLEFDGADGVKLDGRTGDLVLNVRGREVRQKRPFAYQEAGGTRREVRARYVRLGASTFGLSVGDYDRSAPLVIDPVLSYSTYLGGSGFESGGGVAVDPSGNIYVAGLSSSVDFPTTPGVYQQTHASAGWDVFVMKLNPKAAGASGVVFSTYVGGAGNEHALDIALDPAGNVYVAGGSDSTDFPVTANAFQPSPAGSDDGVVFKLSPNGDALLYSTYVGGRSSDGCKGVAVDAAGNVYTVGHTYSDNMRTTAGALQSVYMGGDGDLFVTKLNPSAADGASSLLYSSYLGGSGNEFGGFSIEVDASGALYLTGRTSSAAFPVTPGAFQPTKSGGDDLFITKLRPEGNGAADLVYSTFLGGQGEDRGIGLALGKDGAVYVTGYTTSPDFPTTKSALQTKPAGDRDFFVSKLDVRKSGPAALVYSTLVGGGAMDVGWDIAVDAVGNAYVTGETRSTDLPITAGAFQSAIGGVSDVFSAPGGDAFAAKLNAAGTALVYFTYLGGEGGDAAYHIALDARGNAYVSGGYTFSTNFPTTADALKNSSDGTSESFVAKIDNPSSFASGGASGANGFDASASATEATTAELPNPIEDSRKFVRQQYRDFLNRAPDDAGLDFWTNEIEQCGANAACREVRRVNVSAAFFLSIEFQNTGFLVYRLYRASFARMPSLREFSPDTVVVGQGVVVNSDGWQQKLEANKAAFVEAWAQRADFRALYDPKGDAEYVDALFANAGVEPTQTERAALVGGLAGGTETRATVLRKVVENQALARKESNRAFVLMQYFGYLQRSPDDPPDANLSGYDFWLGKLNEFGGDYIRAEMVKAFISSGEYRRRFGHD